MTERCNFCNSNLRGAGVTGPDGDGVGVRAWCSTDCQAKWHKRREAAAMLKAEAAETVDHPAHYNASPAKCLKCGHPIECIDVVEHLGFSLGNAIKYVWRAPFKGRTLEDLRKAAWYIAREIERVTRDNKSGGVA